MVVPTYDRMLRPLLALSTENALTRRLAESAMADHFALTDADRQERIPSGSSTVVGNRAGWAMTYLTKAGLISKVAPKTYRATDQGRQFLSAHAADFNKDDLAALEGWDEAWQRTRPRNPHQEGGETAPVATPLEAIEAAEEEWNEDLQSRLLEQILGQTPAFFERLVLDVLAAMGYGGSRKGAAHVLGRSGDEGIDGRINQDPLGLDQVMVQAKRYAPDRPIDRSTIQAFIGSLVGQGVTKGVFITTSTFLPSAKEFVLRGANTKIVLIDGKELLDIMLRYRVGVRVQRTIELRDIDQNYFEDE